MTGRPLSLGKHEGVRTRGEAAVRAPSSLGPRDFPAKPAGAQFRLSEAAATEIAAPAEIAYRPIVVETNVPGRPRTINSVRDAARALLYWPPDQRGDRCRTASEACYAALGGTLEPEMARKAFVQAAMVAGIYVKEGWG